MSNELFSVWQFFIGGEYERVRHAVPALEAMKVARDYAHSVGAEMGFVERVIITDSSDHTVFEWKHGEGITWPPKKEGAQHEAS